MAEATLPYVPSYGNITKALNKIKAASTPPRFTQDFLVCTTLCDLVCCGMPRTGRPKALLELTEQERSSWCDGSAGASPRRRWRCARGSC